MGSLRKSLVVVQRQQKHIFPMLLIKLGAEKNIVFNLNVLITFKCGENVPDKLVENPLCTLVEGKQKCKFKNNGCKWEFSKEQLNSHILECKFRTFPCVCKTLGVLQ